MPQIAMETVNLQDPENIPPPPEQVKDHKSVHTSNSQKSCPDVKVWLDRFNKPEINSAGSAIFVLMTAGMNIAWGVEFLKPKVYFASNHILFCWYMAAIIGALVSAFLTKLMEKRTIYFFSAFLVFIGGICFVATADEPAAITAGRYLNGFAVGLVIVPMMVLIGEQVMPNKRGLSAAVLETGSFAFGIFLQIIFDVSCPTVPHHKFGGTQLHGIFAIIFALLTCLSSYFLVVESPVYHLQRNNEHEAIECLRRLQRPPVVTQETYRQLEEHQRYISESDSSDLGLSALVKLCLYRGLVALSFSPVVTAGLLIAAIMSEGEKAKWPLVVFGIFVWLGAYVAGFMMDMVGRKIILLSGALICGIMAISIGGIYCNIFSNFPKAHISHPSQISSVLYMLFVLQFFAGFFNSTASVYMTEAFPLHLKTFYIAVSFMVQMLVWHIIGSCSFCEDRIGPYFITFGVFYVVFFGMSFIFFPETKHNTLRETREKFRSILNRS